MLKKAHVVIAFLPFQQEGRTADDAAAVPTEEEREAGLVLTELFTLAVEDDVATDSEDDHSGIALSTSGAAAELARGGNADGQDIEVLPVTQAARSPGTYVQVPNSRESTSGSIRLPCESQMLCVQDIARGRRQCSTPWYAERLV